MLKTEIRKIKLLTEKKMFVFHEKQKFRESSAADLLNHYVTSSPTYKSFKKVLFPRYINLFAFRNGSQAWFWRTISNSTAHSLYGYTHSYLLWLTPCKSNSFPTNRFCFSPVLLICNMFNCQLVIKFKLLELHYEEPNPL